MDRSHFDISNIKSPVSEKVSFYECRYSNFSYPRHFHEEYLVEIVIKGKNKFYCGGKNVSAQPGNIVLINPGEIHDGTAPKNEMLEYKVFYVDPAVLHELFCEQYKPQNLLSINFRQCLVNDALLFQKINTYFDALQQEHTDNLEASQLYYELMAYIMSRYSTLQSAGEKRSPYYQSNLETLKEYINDNIGDKLLLKDLSRVSAISPFHLLRIFTCNTGITLHKYITVKRIERSKQMLRNKHQIGDISYTLGFSDQSHFTRHFKKMVGTTPAEFQRSFA
ncbi:MAG TPA: AraC family transcriptional regulator [Parafilimonas sp.]|nr:AraC family transcriptional regulator [Parafilimonas sp.]